MRTRYLAMLLAGAFVMQACFKDKGNYDYIPLPEVTVTAEQIDIQTYAGELFTYSPEVTFGPGVDGDDYEFHWEQTMPFDGVAVKRFDGLELQFTPDAVERFSFRFFATNKNTGFTTTANIYVRANAMYGMGWVVLSDDGGKSRLSFVRPEKIDGVRSGYTLFSDVTGELGGNPSKIAWQILRSGTATGANALLVAQQSGAVSVGSGSFVREVYLADEFVQPTPVGFSLAAYAESDFASVALAADGSVYGRYFDNAATLYIDEFLNFPIEYLGQKVAVRKLINMRAYSGYFTAAALVEDNRILWIGWDNPQLYSPNAVSPSVMVTTVGESFDFTAFGDNQLIYAGMVMRPIGLTSVPMRLIYKSGTEYRMQECTAASPRAMQNATITVTLNEPFVGGEYITDNSVFFQLETKDYLFFAEQNRIWFYERATGQVHNIYNFAEGERVVSMASNPQESELGVALESGKLATIAITNDKLLDSELVGMVEGISGRVVDMRYKFASPLQYNRRTQSNNWD